MYRKLASVSLLTGLFSVLASAAWSACFQDDSYATTCHPATQYEIQIQQVEFCKSSACSDPFLVASTSQTFDISSVGVGAAVGNYANLDNVPAGIYTHVRSTISPSITFSAAAAGNCASGRTGYTEIYNPTTSAPDSELATNSGFGITWNSDDTAFEHLHELTTAVAISKAGSLPQIQIDFATQEAALCLGPAGLGNMYPGIPEINIKVLAN